MSLRSNDNGVYWIPCLQWVLGQKILEYTEFLDSNDHVTTAQWVYWFPEGQLESRLNSYLEYTEFLTLHDILNSSLRVYRFPAYPEQVVDKFFSSIDYLGGNSKILIGWKVVGIILEASDEAESVIVSSLDI